MVHKYHKRNASPNESKSSARKYAFLLIAFVNLIHVAFAQTPTTLPPTVPNELTMWHGSEDYPLTTFEWYVPYKFYRITKIEAAVSNNNLFMPGFKLTFQPYHPDVIGWPDEVMTFGDLGGSTYTANSPMTSIDLTTEILEIATCVDFLGETYNSDFERFKVKDENNIEQEIGSNYYCDDGVLPDAYTTLTNRLIGFKIITAKTWYTPNYETIHSIAMIVDTDNCE